MLIIHRCTRNCFQDVVNPELDTFFEIQFKIEEDSKKEFQYQWSVKSIRNHTEELELTGIGVTAVCNTEKLI